MKDQFQRWYGCDESDRFEVTSAVAAELGTHVWVAAGVLDPVDDEAQVSGSSQSTTAPPATRV